MRNCNASLSMAGPQVMETRHCRMMAGQVKAAIMLHAARRNRATVLT
ncbi:hypothetical protein ACMHYO_00225 [Allopusillimonas ginsengisoli]